MVTFKKLSPPEFKTHSLLLSGAIGVNFYMELPGDPAYYENSYMTFSCRGLDAEPVYPDPSFMNDSGWYGFTCYVNSLQMAEEITAVFHYGEGNAETVEDTYSVLQYLNAAEDYYRTGVFPEEALEVVHALKDYGYYAQQYLSRLHGFSLGEGGEYAKMPEGRGFPGNDLMNAADEEEYHRCSVERGENFEALAGLTYSLKLDSETTVNIYCRLKENEDSLSYTFFGDNFKPKNISGTAEKLPDGRYLISVRNIPAHLLDQEFEIQIDDSLVILNLRALSYAYGTLKKDSCPNDMKYAMFSLIQYQKTACRYRESLQGSAH